MRQFAVTDLSIVIVTWNCRRHLMRCLSSVFRHTRGLSFEVVVVDNASGDGTVTELRKSYPDIRLIANNTNVGFARAANQGMAAADGNYLLLLNADTYVHDNVLGRAVEALERRGEIGMLGVRLEFPNGRVQHTAERALSIRRSLLERLWLYKLIPKERRSAVLLGGYWEHDREMEVEWLAGAFMLLRRALFAESGGFDGRFHMYGEDSEWCMRLRRAGHRILFTPIPGRVTHVGSASSDLVWSEKEHLRRCYRGGIESYAALNGTLLAIGYWLAELVGAVVRFSVYSVARMLRRDDYYARQAKFYGWLIEFYVTIGDKSR
jgi:GT2 family glycosyltransferase